MEILDHTVRGKSVNTLTQRASQLVQLLTWTKAHDIEPLPIQENVVYDYLRSPEASSRGATNASRLVEALNFAGGLFGLSGAEAAARSSRVKGKAVDRYLEKRPRCPAKELEDLHLFSLERHLADSANDAEDRVSSGSLLMMSYCRLRSSDLSRIVDCELDVTSTGHGYI